MNTDTTNERRWFALALLVAAQFMCVLDVAIVNVALPTIKTQLHFSQASLQWVITAYAILYGGVLLLGGRLADRFGRRRMFMIGATVFTTASLLAGLAWSEGSLIGFRAFQGLGGALLAPAALSLLTTTFTEGRERNIALGIWGAASGSGGAAGAMLGGIFTSYMGWSWIFFINLPVGAAAVALAPRLLRETRSELQNRRFDLVGAASVTGGLMALVYALTRATQHGWGDSTTVAMLAAAASLLVVFVATESRSQAALLPLRIFRLRTLAVSNASGFVTGAFAFSQFFLLTLYMQEVLGWSAIRTGVAILALALSVIILAHPSQKLATRFGVRSVMPIGHLAAAGALLYYAQMPVSGQYFWDIFPGLVLGGIGIAFSIVPAQIGGSTGVGPADAGLAGGLITTSCQIGGAIGLAVTTTIATTAANGYFHSHVPSATLPAAALTHGFSVAFYVLAAVAVTGAIVAAAFLEPRRSAPARTFADDGLPLGEAA
jgi:EmrB/QacA subfamily drug resistance transporter